MGKSNKITVAKPREMVQIQLPDGSAYDGPRGTTAEAFLEEIAFDSESQVVACLINGRLRELTEPILQDAKFQPLTTADSDGGRIYRRSLSFLLEVAVLKTFPDYYLHIQHSLPSGGYFCEGRYRLSSEQLSAVKREMDDMVEADLPITNHEVPLEDALDLFRQWGDPKKAELFAKRRKDYLNLYDLDGYRDYFHGFMVPRTSYLSTFDLRPYSNGFVLQFPRRSSPNQLQSFIDASRLATIFQEYTDWLGVIGVPTVASLNLSMETDRFKEVVLIAEALHQRQLGNIANSIASRHNSAREIRIILVSGPTSAGKTTFSKRLAIHLLTHGIRPVAIPMDDYFLDREKTPLDEHGEYDFEQFDALNHQLFRQHLKALLAGETVSVPKYDFVTGKSGVGHELSLADDQVLIIEGIHGLNPHLVEGIPSENLFRIFINAFTQLNLDRHNRVPTTDVRLIRRIVRDAATRNYSAAETIARWPSIRLGEKRHIFPHQHNADTFFNSALVYELAALKKYAEPLLLQIEPDSPQRIEANRLLAFLQWFDKLPNEQIIPNVSILREFVGDSALDEFEPWLR